MTTRNNTQRLGINKPGLFEPTVVRQVKDGSSNDLFLDKSDSAEESKVSLGLTSSFKYNQPGQGLFSTQQLNIDWSNFANHTFFNSAQVKSNVAFDKIINEFPFDGTKIETEEFFAKLTGFEKWVYDQFPKNKGYLFFSGSIGADEGTFVTVKDLAGTQFPTVSRKLTGETILEPGTNSMTIEMHLYVPSQSLGDRNQYVLSKLSGSNKGFAVVNEISTGSAGAIVSMMVRSGSNEDKVSISVDSNEWNHLSWVWNRNPGVNAIYAYKNKELVASSSIPYEFGALGTGGKDLYVGSGSNLGTFTPNSTFSGSMDELRIWHSAKSDTHRKKYERKTVFADDDLKLYYKYNEPSGSNSNLVLDYSNNSLHGKLNNRALVLAVRDRATGSISGESPMTYEQLADSPVLFPNVEDSISLRTELLLSASQFDLANPNIITNLVPRHYFLEGQCKDGLENEEGEIVNAPNNGDEPRENELGGTQVLLSLLYVWAKFFDEMKLYIQAFSTLNTVDYDNTDTVPDEFLVNLAKQEGIALPPLFTGTTIEQFIEGENLDSSISTSENTLQHIQNQIWRRILINLREVISSKGTVHSIKSFIRSVGIDPDNVFRIREFGGPTKNSLEFVRENRFEVATMMNFVSGGFITSEPLSASKNEPGFPFDGPSASSNGILTSGSFTYEGTYRFNKSFSFEASQSLARLQMTGSGADTSGSLIANLVAVTSSAGIRVTLFSRPDLSTSSSVLILPLTGANIFDGDQWYISFGRQRNDDGLNSRISSSYFIRAAKQNAGTILESYSTASFFADEPGSSVWQKTTSDLGPPVLNIGSSSLAPSATSYLLDSSTSPEASRHTNFEGKVGQIRFWSKYITNKEWPEHVRNYRSVGVQDPRANFNFVNENVSGSWARLRLDASTDQIDLQSDSSGKIDLTDFTQNYLGMSGSGFPATSSVIVPERFSFSFLSPKIDEGATVNKVRVRSLQDTDKVADSPWAQTAPVYDTTPAETPTDSTKLSIDFSVVDSLDQDIISIFSTFDEMNNMIGNPELIFSSEYPDLRTLRNVYFNKLEGKMNLKGFFEFYKWFDTNIGTFVEQLIPRKAKFFGSNFVIESHLLERSKLDYKFEDHYLGEDVRSGLRDTLLLQLISGEIDRF